MLVATLSIPAKAGCELFCMLVVISNPSSIEVRRPDRARALHAPRNKTQVRPIISISRLNERSADYTLI
jgi:hypothetical protein